jgi:hypothetical protein
MAPLSGLFNHVCGQNHCWALGNEVLPFCERCTGLYAGAAAAAILWAIVRPRPTSRVLWIHGMFLLLMVPFGFHLVPQNGTIRTLTGHLFAFGLVYYLSLMPVAWIEEPGRSSARRRETARVWIYGAGLIGSLALLQLAVHGGGAFTGVALSYIGLVGLALYALLVVANVAAFPRLVARLIRRAPVSSPP